MSWQYTRRERAAKLVTVFKRGSNAKKFAIEVSWLLGEAVVADSDDCGRGSGGWNGLVSEEEGSTFANNWTSDATMLVKHLISTQC